MNISDMQRMATDVENLAVQLEEKYREMLPEEQRPPPGRVLLEAQCAWSLMVFERMLKERDDRAKKARDRATIIRPNGGPF